MTDQLPSKDEKLLIELRGWHTLKGADCFRQAADEIETLRRKLDTCGLECSEGLKRLAAENEELRRELAREVGTRAARVAEIDALRRRVNELAAHAEKWVKRALGCPCEQLEGPCPNCNQWVVLKPAQPPGDGQ